MFTFLILICAQKCTYCNFASGVFPRGMEARYVEVLRAEIARHRLDLAEPCQPHSVLGHS